jgi:diaminopimelate decarboxylase
MELQGTSRINHKGHLEIGGNDVVDLVANFGTPLYVLDEQEIKNKMRQYIDSFSAHRIPFQVAYASKALSTSALYLIVEQEKLSLDVVSGGELYTAINAGFPAERIHFHGNNKQYSEIELAIDSDIGAFAIDNLYEIGLINEIAGKKGKKVKALLRITPSVDVDTHEYISTGRADSKFGFNLVEPALAATERVLESDSIELLGYHFHIGSQLFDMSGFKVAIERATILYKMVAERYQLNLPVFNTGGGLGIRYTRKDQPLLIKSYVDQLIAICKENFAAAGMPLPELWIEPGRSIVGEAGTTLYTVGSTKEIPSLRKYIAIDGGMMDNPRPALYQAVYEAVIANRMNEAESAQEIVTVAGRACESSDILIKDIALNSPKSGDILAVFSTGAYNYSMASNYNRIPRPAVILVSDGNADLIVERESYQDLIAKDKIPERLKHLRKG